MNAVGIALLWCVVQVTLLGFVSGGLYLIVRRLRPAAAASVALTGLLTVVLLSVLALAPWPRWQLAEVAPQPNDTSPARADASTSSREEAPDDSPEPIAGQEIANNRLLRAAWWWQSFVVELSRTQPGAAEIPWRWPAIVAALVLTGMGAGAGWLVLGLLAVRWQRVRSRPVEDPALLDLVAVLGAGLGCRRPIEVRQSNDLATAATIGWRRPVILLPPQWPAWTSEQRRAVLAHEIAHVRRNDFLAVLGGQLGLVLHFYHPLLHWLMGRLRLEQELAADADAASVMGGQMPYLMTLAELALRQDDRPLLWPARSFLPTQTTFLRRIAMLRNSSVRSNRNSPIGRGLAVGAVLVCGLLVAGLRGPAGRQEALAEAEDNVPAETQSAGTAKELTGIDLTYIPEDAFGIIAIRPAAIFREPGLAEYGKLWADQSAQVFPAPITEIEQITAVMLGRDLLSVIQTRKAGDLHATLRGMPKAAKKEYEGKTYYVEVSGPHVRVISQLNDRTFVETRSEESLKKLVSGRKGLPTFIDVRALRAFEGDHVVVAVEPSKSKLAQLIPDPAKTSDGVLLSVFAPLWKNTTWVAGGVRIADQVQIRGVAFAASQEDSQKVRKTLEAAITLCANMANEARAAAKRERQTPHEAFNVWTLDVLDPLLASVRVTETEGNVVRIESSVGMDAVRKMLPPIGEARKAADRAQSTNNLKQIALAMHNYHDRYKCLPPAVLYGPDGKTPYSWRVALLPFLEQEALYKQYRFDEPWDGPNNRRLAETRIPVYHAPGEADRSANASYFALVGPGTVFEKKEDQTKRAAAKKLPRVKTDGVSFAEIVDGLSNTLMIVEAKRDIPWSNPEDIPYDPKKPLPELGGYFEGGFHAALCDGSVRFLPKGFAEAKLRALITGNGRELFNSYEEFYKR